MFRPYLSELLDYALEKGLIQPADEIYAANRVLHLIGGESFERTSYETHQNIEEILKGLLDFAAQQGKLEMNTTTYRDILSADIMDVFTPMPSVLQERFLKKYAVSPKEAMDYFYGLSKDNNYIMTNRIQKNVVWKTKTKKYGELDLTINLSKPEKDPKEITLAKLSKQTGYPKCQLCKENVGFEGHANHPARANHRVIPIQLGEEEWYFQYSPYGYFNEHSILLHTEHQPMSVTGKTFERLLSFVEQYPHYMMGSNAGLPIVGGSILTHDHYQGGCYEFPLAKCAIRTPLVFEGFEDVSAGVVEWILSTIRLEGTDKNRVIELAEKIHIAWQSHSDKENEILAFTDAPHNAITPIATMKNGRFILDLILRNNRTSEQYPYGIFHAHEEYHSIKKENIGLIEAMGLAVLPPRLLPEDGVLTEERKEEIGLVFEKILENCAVFKDTECGRRGMQRFVSAVGLASSYHNR